MGNYYQDSYENRRREREQEENELLYKYGTTDPRRIAEIEKEKSKNNRFGCFIVLFILIGIPFLLGLISWLFGGDVNIFNGLFDNSGPWEPRHT
jgi:hypothetical protein